MTLQEWFDYLKASANGEDDRDISIEEALENPSIKFYYDGLKADIVRMAYEDKVEIFFEEYIIGEYESIMPASLRNFQEKTNCTLYDLYILCKEALEYEEEIGRLYMLHPHPILDEECAFCIFSANEANLIKAIYMTTIPMETEKSALELMKVTGDEYEDALMEYLGKDIDELNNDVGNRLLIKYKNFMLECYDLDVIETLIDISIEGFKQWYIKKRLLPETTIVSFINEIADEIAEFILQTDKEIEFNYVNGMLDSNNLPMKFCILIEAMKNYYLYNFWDFGAEKDDYKKHNKFILDLIDFSIKRGDIKVFIEKVKEKDKIVYRNKIKIDLIEMASTDEVKLYIDTTNIHNNKVPKSFEDYQKRTKCSIEELQELCTSLMERHKYIIPMLVVDDVTGEMDDCITFSGNENLIIKHIKESDIIKRVSEFISQNRKAHDDIDGEVSKIETVFYDDDAEEIIGIYKKLMKPYYKFDMHEDFETIKKDSFKKWQVKAKLLGQNERIMLFGDICDDIVNYFSKESESLVLYHDGRNLLDIKLPKGIYMFIEEFKENPEFVIELVNRAIERAGVQDAIEVTSDEEKITYKNKVFM